jgi:phage tail-like protein
MPSGTSNRSDIFTTFHFYIDIEGIPQAVFTEVTGLEVEVEVTNYEEGGVNDYVHRLPGRVKVSDITLKNGVTTSNELWDWYKQILQGNFKRRNVSIIMVDQHGTEKMRWNFIKALPVKWTGPQFKSDQSGGAIQSLQLSHKGLQIT